MISVSEDVKNAYNQSTTQTDKIVLNGKEYKINNVEYIDDTYLDGNIFGTAIARQLSFEIEACNIEKQEFEYLTGIKVNGSIQWISLGNFITQDVQESDTMGMIKVEAMDYMLKTNIPYKTLLQYSTGKVTLYDVAIEACRLAGLTLATGSLVNGDFIVDSNQFEQGTLVRQVIQAIAQISGTVAKIKSNNFLYFINPNQVTEISKVFTLHDYHNIDIKRNTHPINTVILGMANIEGENVVLRDEEAVLNYGENRIVFNDNPFAYTEDKRRELIVPLFNAIKGFEYKSVEIDGQAYPFLETLDKIQFIGKDGNTYDSYIFRFNYKGPNGLDSITEAPSITNATIKYENVMSAEEISKRTEIIVDKQNQQISSVISQTIDRDNPDSMSNKLSKVSQTVDELNSKISDIADITTSLESNSARLEFEGINQSEPIRVVIHPVGVNIAKLHPHTNLKPSINLVIKTRILRFTNTTTQEVWNYEIPDDLLYYDSENYDEFILDYESLSCVINKKCKWNNDGTVGLLPSERAVEYEFPHIELTEGDYTVSLIKYSNGYLFARMMMKNYYTAQFATRAELNSDIKQTVDDINLSVGKKLEGYSTTTEMNSAIDVKANAITQSVSENYATKTALGNTETSLKSEIRSTAEAITTSVSETYVTNQSLEDNYSTTEQTASMISTTVSQTTKNNLKDVTVEYALGTSTTTAPTSGWSTTAPTWQQGKYMWQRTKTKTADGTESTSNPTCIAGAKGQDGTNGVSISSITEYYAVSSSNSSAPADSAFKTTMQTMTATNKYLWNYEVITYSNNNTQKTIKRVIGTYGDKGTDGTNGIGITSVTNKYQVSSSNTTAPTTWKDTPQTMTATNKYLWNYEIITYSDNTTTTSTPAVIGVYGDKGQTGNTGKGVKAVVAQYYLSSSKTTQTGGSWAETQPAYKKDYYYWTRTKITWTDDTVTYTTPILVEEINSLNESVASLNIRTNAIETSVTEKVGKNEFGTYITQNKDSVKLAWNQISEYIQMMIINNNASFAILDSSKKPIAYFDKTGIHFSSNNTAFGEMGVQTVDGNKFIAFSVDGTYGSAINNGMAWGIKTTTDNKFHPIFYIKNFEMGSQQSDAVFGELVLSASNLLLDGIGTGLITGGIKIFGDPTAGGMYFYDVNASKYLMQIFPNDGAGYGEIQILDNIIFNKVSNGENRLFIGPQGEGCQLTDTGAIICDSLSISSGGFGIICDNNITAYGGGTFNSIRCYGNINCDGNVYAENFISDKRLKKNIKDSKDNALDIINKINIHSFDWKEDNSHVDYGFIAQELEEIDKNYILKQEMKSEKEEVTDYKYYVNELPIIATLTKAIQEQQAQIEELQKEIKELKGGK